MEMNTENKNATKTRRTLAAFAAAVIALTASGCGNVEKEASAEKTSAGAAETVTTAASETTAAETTAPVTNTPAEYVGGSRLQTIFYKDGCEGKIKYTPTEKEMDTLTKLAISQYNAVLAQNGREYLSTLGLKKLYEGEDIVRVRELARVGAAETSAYASVLNESLSLPEDVVYLSHKELIEHGDFTSDEQFEENERKLAEALGSAISSLDGAELVKVNEAYCESDRLPDCDYIVGDEDEHIDIFLSDNAVCISTITSSEEKDGGKYIEFELIIKDDTYTIPFEKVCAWIKDGEYGINIGSVTTAQDYACRGDYNMRIMEFNPSDEEMNSLAELARRQYNAVVERNAAEYLATMAPAKLFEGTDIAKVIKDILYVKDKSAYDLAMLGGLTLPWDAVRKTRPKDFDFEEEFDFDQAEDEYRSAIGAALGDINEAFLNRYASEGDMKNSYFLSFKNGTQPLGSGAELSTIVTGTVERDGGRYITFDIAAKDGDRMLDLGSASGWFKGGESGVYLDLNGERLHSIARDISNLFINDKPAAQTADPSEEQISEVIDTAVKQYNAIFDHDAAAYLETLKIGTLIGGKDPDAMYENLSRSYEQSAYEQTMDKVFYILNDYMWIDNPSYMYSWTEGNIDEDDDEGEGESKPDPESIPSLKKAYEGLNAEWLQNADPFTPSIPECLYCNFFYFMQYGKRRSDGGEFKRLPDGAEYAYKLRGAEEKDGGIFFRLSLTFFYGNDRLTIPDVKGWVKNGETGVYVDLASTEFYPSDEYEYAE